MQLVATGRCGSTSRSPRSSTEWRGADRDVGDGPRSAGACVRAAGAAGRSAAGDAGASSSTRSARIAARVRSRGTRSIYSDLGFILLGFHRGRSRRGDACRSSSTDVMVRLKPDAAAANGGRRAGYSRTIADVRARRRPRAGAPRRRGRWTTMRGADALLDRRSPRQLRGRARRRRRPRRPVRHGAGGRRVCAARAAAPPAATDGCRRRSRRRWFAQFTTKSTVPGSSRALGWDTMLPTSSCGTRMSRGGVRPRRLYRHIALDRSRTRSLLRAADQPRLRRRHARRDARRSAARFTMRSVSLTAEHAELAEKSMLSAFSAVSAVSLL